MQAEINLMEEALKQPFNERFVLLSETCIPLYPATFVWAQLLSEAKSRIHACAKLGDSDDESRRMTYRCTSYSKDEANDISLGGACDLDEATAVAIQFVMIFCYSLSHVL